MRHLAVETTGQPDALIRVLVLLRRRRCRVVAVDYREADRHGPGRFRISVEAPARLGHCVDDWLMGLVDVLEVHEPGVTRVTDLPVLGVAGLPELAVLAPEH